jgi:hypothetical protein
MPARISQRLFALLVVLLSCGCALDPSPMESLPTAASAPQGAGSAEITAESPTEVPLALPESELEAESAIEPASVDQGLSAGADVVSVSVSGQPGAYQFSVGISSPDTGCDQYADWWEVLGEDGTLYYRRILTHSHVSEQPFERSGGPVAVEAGTVLVVRAHMNTSGYGGKVLKGSVQAGWTQVELGPGFASDVETADPQPSGCGF